MPHSIIVTALQPCTVLSLPTLISQISQAEEAECPSGRSLRIQTTVFHVKKERGGPLKTCLATLASTGFLAGCKQGKETWGGPEGRSSWLAKGSWLLGRTNQEEGEVGISVHCRMASPLPWLCIILWWVKYFSWFFPFSSGKRSSTHPLGGFYTKPWKKPGWCGISCGGEDTGDWAAHILWGWEWGSLTVYSQGRKRPREHWRWRKRLLKEHQSHPGQLAWRLWQSATAGIWRWEAVSFSRPSICTPSPLPPFQGRGPGERPCVYSHPLSAPLQLEILYGSYLNSFSLNFLNCSVSVWTVLTS